MQNCSDIYCYVLLISTGNNVCHNENATAGHVLWELILCFLTNMWKEMVRQTDQSNINFTVFVAGQKVSNVVQMQVCSIWFKMFNWS